MRSHSNRRGRQRLAFALLAIAAVWLVVLPRVARLETLDGPIKALEKRGVDPSAFFYTDHPFAHAGRHKE